MIESPDPIELRFIEAKRLLELNFPGIDEEKIQQAFDFDRQVQGHKFRKSGESAVMHPLALANSLLEDPVFVQSTNPEIQAIYANPERVNELMQIALIHDVIEELTEDEKLTEDHLREIRDQFGDRVFGVVSLLSKNIGVDYTYQDQLHPEVNEGEFFDPKHAWKNRMQREQLEWHGDREGQDDTFPVLGLTPEEQQEALTMARVVKAADLLHNVQTAEFLGAVNGARFIDEANELWVTAYERWQMPEIARRLMEEIKNTRSRLPQK